jgi:hypothetical protein
VCTTRSECAANIGTHAAQRLLAASPNDQQLPDRGSDAAAHRCVYGGDAVFGHPGGEILNVGWPHGAVSREHGPGPDRRHEPIVTEEDAVSRFGVVEAEPDDVTLSAEFGRRVTGIERWQGVRELSKSTACCRL